MNSLSSQAAVSGFISSAVPVFAELSSLFHQAHLFNHSHPYKKGQVLYYEGDIATGIYHVEEGEIKTFKTGFGGKQNILHIAHAHEIIGLESLFLGDTFKTSAEVLSDTRVSFADKKIIHEIIQKNSAIANKVMEALASELVVSEEERVDLAQHSVRERMARLLSLLSESNGIEVGGGIQIDLPISREELAEMIGTVAETAVRLLKEFREEHLVEVRKRKIIIIDKARLIRAAHLHH